MRDLVMHDVFSHDYEAHNPLRAKIHFNNAVQRGHSFIHVSFVDRLHSEKTQPATFTMEKTRTSDNRRMRTLSKALLLLWIATLVQNCVSFQFRQNRRISPVSSPRTEGTAHRPLSPKPKSSAFCSASASASRLFRSRDDLSKRPTAPFSALYATSPSDDEASNDAPSTETPSSDDAVVSKDWSSSSNDANNEKMGVTRMILLAVPLFCKFCIVLAIKFVTDLVVFPLLLLYRLARNTKRKVLSLFNKKSDQDSAVNGTDYEI